MSLKQQQQQQLIIIIIIITSGPRVTPVLGECRKQLIALKTYIIIIIIIIIIVIKLNLNRCKEKKIV